MVRQSHLMALSLVFCAAASSRGDSLDLIPADALGSAACRSIAELVKKSEELIKDAEIKLPEQPAELCKQLFSKGLGITAGLDTKGGCSLVVVNKKHIGADLSIGIFGGKSNLEEYVVLAIPFSDLDAMAGNFGFEKGKLKPETMATMPMSNGFNKLCYAKGKHIYLGGNEKAILSVVKGKTLGEDLSAARRKSLAEADCLCHIGLGAWEDKWKEGLRGAEQADAFGHIKDEAERKTMREFMDSLVAVRHVFGTCKLGGGFGCSCMCIYPKEGSEAAKKFLAALRAGDGGSSLAGLPEGNVIAATAARGDGSKNAHIAKLGAEILQRSLLESNRIFGAADRHTILSVFNEVWPHLRGSRLALYKTADERKLGLFSAVGIFDVEDTDKFLAQLRSLVKLGSGDGLDLSSEAGKEKSEAEIKQLIEDLGARRFQTRESAKLKLLLAGEQVLPYLEKAVKSMDLETSRRAERIKAEIVQAAEERRKELLSGNLARAIKPSFVFLDKKEKLEGFEFYNIGVKLKKDDAAMAPQFRQLLGPDWARVRVGVQGKQLVVLAGSDVKLLDEAMRNLKENKPGFASAAALGDQAKKIETGRKMEFHASMAMAAALATAADLAKPGKIPANPPLTTVALTVEEDRLQCDLWLPIAEIKVIAKTAQDGQ